MEAKDLQMELAKLDMRVANVESNFSEIKDLQQKTLKEISSLHTSLLERVNDSQNAFTSLKERHNALESRVQKVEKESDKIELTLQKTQISLAKLAVIGGGSGALMAGLVKLLDLIGK